jgi:hypothetical protein
MDTNYASASSPPKQAERQILELTLNGAIRILADLLQSASPKLGARSRGIRDCTTWISQRIDPDESWQYDLAATLCLIGCITIPEETFQRCYGGENVSPEEEAMFLAHPEIAARMLANIPRLEPIAEMIRLQVKEGVEPGVSGIIETGARMLQLAVELDRRIYRGLPFRSALRELKSMEGRFDPEMLMALTHYSPASPEFHREALPIKQLYAGMLLEEDVIGESTGTVIFRKDTTLNDTWLERLKNFARSQGVKEPLRVWVPGPAGVPVFRGLS